MFAQIQLMFIKLFPPTIHPMVVHFTIAILYLAVLTEVISVFRPRDSFFERAGYILLGLGVLATLAAGVAGVISESYDRITPAVSVILNTHRFYGELTGVLFLTAWLIRSVTRYLKIKARTPVFIALLISLIGLVVLSYVGYLGGSMVYDHGLGVIARGLGRHPL